MSLIIIFLCNILSGWHKLIVKLSWSFKLTVLFTQEIQLIVGIPLYSSFDYIKKLFSSMGTWTVALKTKIFEDNGFVFQMQFDSNLWGYCVLEPTFSAFSVSTVTKQLNKII